MVAHDVVCHQEGNTLSTRGRERRPRSRCHWRWAATRPLASRRAAAPLALAGAQSPDSSAYTRAIDSATGVDDPAGRQSAHTAPPAGTENARFGPGAPHRAHSASAGSHPATDMA